MKVLYMFLIGFLIGLFCIVVYFGLAIMDSHNICNGMNLTECLK